MMATSRPAFCAVSRTSVARSMWSCAVPCEKFEPHDVDAGADHALQHLGRRRRGPESGDDLGLASFGCRHAQGRLAATLDYRAAFAAIGPTAVTTAGTATSPPPRRPPASAVMLTTRRIVADGVRMCAGRAAPSRIGPDRHAVPAGHLEHVEQDVGGVEVRQQQQVGRAGQRASRAGSSCGSASDSAASPCISPSHSTSGASCANSSRACAHAPRRRPRRASRTCECERNATFGGRPKRRTLVGGHQRDLGQRLRVGLVVDEGVGEEQRVRRRASARSSRRSVRAPGFRPITVAHVLEVAVVAADQPAQHRVGVAAAQHHRRDQRVRAPHAPPSPSRA